MKKNSLNNITKVYNKEVDGSKKAVMHYSIIKNLKSHFLLEIKLETGRSHQIRSQLGFIGSPIKGDLKYGFDRSNKNGGIHLHAKKIQFTHPVTKENLEFTAPLPDDVIWNACK